MIDFSNINYLQNGTPKQIEAYELLTQKQVLEGLAEYTPVLAGTIPINIDVENSDLDILCCWNNKEKFIRHLDLLFGKEAQFKIVETDVGGYETVIANFRMEAFELEVFGQPLPVTEQNGYRHMILEYDILQSKGESFRQEVIRLKQQGYKTEPAFALLLGIGGDPYVGLLDFKL